MPSSYSTRLRDPRWLAKRDEVIGARGHRCAKCGEANRTLHVHHTHYVRGRMPWEYSASSLEVLCAGCHMAEHPRQTLGARLRRQLAALEAEGVTSDFQRVRREAILRALAVMDGPRA